MNKEDEARVLDYLKEHDLRGERFAKEELRNGKTPDFRVMAGLELAFFCEVKSIAYDTFAGGGRSDPIFNRLTDDIHTAIKQFDAVNSRVEYPNVLVFINHDELCGIQDLFGVVTGNFIAENDKLYPVYRKYSEGRIKDEKARINLFVWLNDSGSQHLLFHETNLVFHLKLCNWFGVAPETIKHFGS